MRHTSHTTAQPSLALFLDHDKCLCGAKVADGGTTCRKCHARARWTRRTLRGHRSTALLLAAAVTLFEAGRA
jgi:hypothetical protein